MTKDEALKLALEALHGFIPYLPLNDEAQCGRYDKAITAIKEALAQQEQEVDWEKLYRLEVKKKEALAAKYEQDIKPLTKIIPMAQPEQEPVACVYKATTKKGEIAHFGEYSAAKAWAGWGTVEQVPLKTLTLISKSIKPCPTCEALARTVMLDQTSHDTTPPQRKPLTDEEVEKIIKANMCLQMNLAGIRQDFEVARGIKGEA